MPRELFQSPALPRAFTQTGGPSPTIRKRRHRSDPPVPAWCKLTPAIVRAGRETPQYQHAIDRYAIEAYM